MNKDELKQFRERIGLTQGGLSKALGVANNTVSRWELGQRSIPEFLPLALETIERRLSKVKDESTVGSKTENAVIAPKAPKPTDGMLSTVEVATRLNVSRKSVNDYIIDGKLKAMKGKQGHNFVSEADLTAFVESRN
jgi:DNA-binding transcriptional regulator YiaG